MIKTEKRRHMKTLAMAKFIVEQNAKLIEFPWWQSGVAAISV